MPRYFIQMAYDGTRYKGWQVQPDGITVQQVMEETLSTLLKDEIRVTGAGRTDTGVHASYFVAHFDTGAAPDQNANPDPAPNHAHRTYPDPTTNNFIFRLNRFLPPDIVVYRITRVPSRMHARFSAIHRTYHYHISSIKPLYTRDYTHYVYGALNLEEIDRCCGMIMETRDFTSFSKLRTDVATNNCTVMHAEWKTLDTGYLFEIRADRFLRNMVRSLVGTLLQAGMGKITAKEFSEIIRAKDRRSAGMSAPAPGLFLVDIGYGVFNPFG